MADEAHDGPLTRKILGFEQTMKKLVPTIKAPADWAPRTPFIFGSWSRAIAST